MSKEDAVRLKRQETGHRQAVAWYAATLPIYEKALSNGDMATVLDLRIAVESTAAYLAEYEQRTPPRP